MQMAPPLPPAPLPTRAATRASMGRTRCAGFFSFLLVITHTSGVLVMRADSRVYSLQTISAAMFGLLDHCDPFCLRQIWRQRRRRQRRGAARAGNSIPGAGAATLLLKI